MRGEQRIGANRQRIGRIVPPVDAGRVGDCPAPADGHRANGLRQCIRAGVIALAPTAGPMMVGAVANCPGISLPPVVGPCSSDRPDSA